MRWRLSTGSTEYMYVCVRVRVCVCVCVCVFQHSTLIYSKCFSCSHTLAIHTSFLESPNESGRMGRRMDWGWCVSDKEVPICHSSSYRNVLEKTSAARCCKWWGRKVVGGGVVGGGVVLSPSWGNSRADVGFWHLPRWKAKNLWLRKLTLISCVSNTSRAPNFKIFIFAPLEPIKLLDTNRYLRNRQCMTESEWIWRNKWTLKHLRKPL